MYNPISTSIDAKTFYGWRRDQPNAQEDNVSHQSPDSPSMFSDDSNDAKTDETNEADGAHKNVEEEHTTAPMIPIKKKIPLALRRLKDYNASGSSW